MVALSGGWEGALTMLVLIKLVRNEFPVSKHMRVKNKTKKGGGGLFPAGSRKAAFELENRRALSLAIRRCIIYKLARLFHFNSH